MVEKIKFTLEIECKWALNMLCLYPLATKISTKIFSTTSIFSYVWRANIPLSDGPATVKHCSNCTQVNNEVYNLHIDSNSGNLSMLPLVMLFLIRISLKRHFYAGGHIWKTHTHLWENKFKHHIETDKESIGQKAVYTRAAITVVSICISLNI